MPNNSVYCFKTYLYYKKIQRNSWGKNRVKKGGYWSEWRGMGPGRTKGSAVLAMFYFFQRVSYIGDCNMSE